MSAEPAEPEEAGGGGVAGVLRNGVARCTALVTRKLPGATGRQARSVPSGAGDADGTEGPGPEGSPAGARPGPVKRLSRRFPAVTRDTARPEGGGRAGGGAAPYRQWPLLAVSGAVLIGLLVTVLQFRVGTLIIGLAMIGGAVLRWRLPTVGMLAVRSRFTDTVTYALLGAVIVTLALMTQPNPLISIPFLKNIVHFSVR